MDQRADDDTVVVERLREAAKWDEIHYRDCDTTGPIPFPCDCTATADVLVLLALLAETGVR